MAFSSIIRRTFPTDTNTLCPHFIQKKTSVKELKAEGGAKSALQEQEMESAPEEYMDDIENYGEDLKANVYDDDYLSSDGENVADVTIDLLEDEEFPDVLDQEEMVHHALALNTYDHELEEPSSSKRSAPADSQVHSIPQRHPQTPQRQLVVPQHQQRQRAESISKSSRDLQQQSAKGRKIEASSRLPMPRSFQQQANSSSPSSSGSSNMPVPRHRHSNSGASNSGASGRNNSASNSSPPLAARSREAPKPSPSLDVTMSSASSTSSTDYISHKGSSGSANAGSPGVTKLSHPSVNTKNSHSSSALASVNNGSAGADLHNFAMESPTSPQVTSSASTPAVVTGGDMSMSNGRATWSSQEMEEFLREHRSQLRDFGELTKRETKLLANVTLGMSSAIHAQSTGYSNNRESFQKYLSDLDEIVDEKLIAIVDMSQKLKALRGGPQA